MVMLKDLQTSNISPFFCFSYVLTYMYYNLDLINRTCAFHSSPNLHGVRAEVTASEKLLSEVLFWDTIDVVPETWGILCIYVAIIYLAELATPSI